MMFNLNWMPPLRDKEVEEKVSDVKDEFKERKGTGRKRKTIQKS